MKDIKKVREQLHLLKLQTFEDLEDDMSNLDDILERYRVIHKSTKVLFDIEGQNVQDVLATHPSEFHFFITCAGNIRAFLDYLDSLIKNKRGRKYQDIKGHTSRDLNHAAINQLIDGHDDIFDLFSRYLKVKEVHDKFLGRVESYRQRGYTLNNLIKASETGFLGVDI